MVRYQRIHHHSKINIGEDEELHTILVQVSLKRAKPTLLFVLFLSLLSCSFLLAPHVFTSSSPFSLLDSFGREDELANHVDDKDVIIPPCSSLSNGSICCDRSGFRSDICKMKGDVRTHSASMSIFLYTDKVEELKNEKIKPYTRKWETSIMETIDDLSLVSKKQTDLRNCDVVHDVPAVFFSTGGYTGNVYHEFNDGLLPLYITSQHFNRRVVFVILDYHEWWVMKYRDILGHLSQFSPINFSKDKRTHCFTEAIVGLRIHNELTVDPSLTKGNKGIVDFRNLLDRAYLPRIKSLNKEEEIRGKANVRSLLKKPKLVLLSRNGSRGIKNEAAMVKMAEEIGFRVQVLRPDRTMELAKIYRELNSSSVMVGVHGAAMTHFLFMKPASVFIQIIPLGTDWAAETYYGEPAKKLGLKYIGYPILPRESSLYNEYKKDDPVLRDPDSINRKGWQYTKEIYLEHQNVRLHLGRFRKRLVRAYEYSIGKINPGFHAQA